MSRHVIARVDELPPGTRKFLTIDRRPIAVFNIKGEFFGLLKWWLDAQMPYTPEAMDEMFHRLVNPTIKTALQDRNVR